eukprot:2918726-Prymnesium_polylepis.1
MSPVKKSINLWVAARATAAESHPPPWATSSPLAARRSYSSTTLSARASVAGRPTGPLTTARARAGCGSRRTMATTATRSTSRRTP